MTFPQNLSVIKQWKQTFLDSKSQSFCGAKWYWATIWLWRGWTASCHHNPPHKIDQQAIVDYPSALHNTPKKINERGMMQRGERPMDCQYCWVVEDMHKDAIPDRVIYSKDIDQDKLQTAFESESQTHVTPTYIELGFDSTCNLACSYCCPDISTSWMRDIKKNGPYQNITTDERNHYTMAGSDGDNYSYGDYNPYTEAFFKWWETDLHQSLKNMHITGGEPMMSGHFWKFLDWLEANPERPVPTIAIQTNLAYDSDTLNKFLTKIANTKAKIRISTSAESTGSKAQYVRDGLNWDQWCKNIDTLINHRHIIQHVTIMSTISAVSLNGFVEFLSWLVEKKRQTGRSYFGLYVSYVRWPTFQNVIVLPMEKRKQHSAELQSFFDSNFTWFTPNEQNYISRLIKYLVEIEVPHRGSIINDGNAKFTDASVGNDVAAMTKDFKSFFVQYDQRRNKNFGATFPDLKQWYDSVQLNDQVVVEPKALK